MSDDLCDNCIEKYCPKKDPDISVCGDFICKHCLNRKGGQSGTECDYCGNTWDD